MTTVLFVAIDRELARLGVSRARRDVCVSFFQGTFQLWINEPTGRPRLDKQRTGTELEALLNSLLYHARREPTPRRKTKKRGGRS